MPKLLPDQTFYPSPTMAMQAPAETTRLRGAAQSRPGRAATPSPSWTSIPRRARYGAQIVARRHARRRRRAAPLRLERVQLVPVPVLAAPAHGAALPRRAGHALVAHPHPRHRARSAAARDSCKVIEPDEVIRKTGYSRPHTAHCGPDGIYINALGDAEGNGPGGIFVLDPETFEIKGRWEHDRGPQYLAYDFWWHLGHDTMITSEWGTPNMVEDGVEPGAAARRASTATRCTSGICNSAAHLQKLELGAEQQMVLELRPAHDPDRDLRLRRRRHQPRRTCRRRSGCGTARAATATARGGSAR